MWYQTVFIWSKGPNRLTETCFGSIIKELLCLTCTYLNIWFWKKKSYLENWKCHQNFFILFGTNNLYPIPLGVCIYDCQSNMRAELPVFRLEHPKLCWRKHTPILACALSAHGCVWKIWSGWNSASIFRSQPSFYMCKQAACRLWVGDVKKIDVKPIFTVPDMMPNLAIMSGTVKISAALFFLI